MDEKKQDPLPPWVGVRFTRTTRKAKKARRQERNRHAPVRVWGPMPPGVARGLLKHVETTVQVVLVLVRERGTETPQEREEAPEA